MIASDRNICYCDYCDAEAEIHFARTTIKGNILIYDYCKDCSERLEIAKHAKLLTEEQYQNYLILK